MARLPVWAIKDLVECIDYMIDNKFDCVIFLQGKRGLGKTTLGYKISMRTKARFNPSKDMHFARRDVIQALTTKKKQVVFADELINAAFNRDFYETDQKLLIKALNMYRDSFNLFIGCIPFFVTLDNQMQKLCKILITVVRRGVALIQTQVPSIYMSDPWDLKNNQKIEAKWSLKGIKNPRYAQLTTVRGILYFNDLTPKQRVVCEAVKHEKRNRIFHEQAGLDLQDNPEKRFYDNLITRLKTKTITPKIFAEVCQVYGKKYRSVQVRVNEILRERGENERFKDLVSLNNTITKIDKLGFKVTGT